MKQRISTEGYQALREALSAITWFKDEFKSFLHAALRGHPELLALLNFQDTKRSVADTLVQALVERETQYQDLTLHLMLEVAGKTRFPDIERLPEPDRSQRLGIAHSAVAHLKDITGGHEAALMEKSRFNAELRSRETQSLRLQTRADNLARLKERFIGLQSQDDRRQVRGYQLEQLLADLFALYDLEPRLAYATDTEQIDGSFRFDTDDYIVEAKWRAAPSSRQDADIFAAKVRSKGKNAMGLFVSINSFTQPFIERFNEGTPFITMDGDDLFLILDDRVRLDDVLRAKRRHSNDTGSCYYPVRQFLTI